MGWRDGRQCDERDTVFDWTQKTSLRERSFSVVVGIKGRALLAIFPACGPGQLAEWPEALGLCSLECPCVASLAGRVLKYLSQTEIDIGELNSEKRKLKAKGGWDLCIPICSGQPLNISLAPPSAAGARCFGCEQFWLFTHQCASLAARSSSFWGFAEVRCKVASGGKKSKSTVGWAGLGWVGLVVGGAGFLSHCQGSNKIGERS